MKKIKVKYEVSNDKTSQTFTPEDLGHTAESWAELTMSEKETILMDAIIEQPFWVVTSFQETE
jgi:hypothetical protein